MKISLLISFFISVINLYPDPLFQIVSGEEKKSKKVLLIINNRNKLTCDKFIGKFEIIHVGIKEKDKFQNSIGYYASFPFSSKKCIIKDNRILMVIDDITGLFGVNEVLGKIKKDRKIIIIKFIASILGETKDSNELEIEF
jgi:hypothetical protein